MTNNRPSFFEFSGYFNVCEADYKRFAINDWKENVICDQDPIPPLTSKENDAAKDAVAAVMVKAGYSQSDLEENVSFLWPQLFFSIDRVQTDRTARIYLSSALMLTTDLTEQVRLLLQSKLPNWRAVVVLPEGEDPGLVIYNDVLKLGRDRVGSSAAVFDTMKAKWIAAENQCLAIQSTQFAHLNNQLPAQYLNNQRNLFLMGSFAWSFKPSDSQTAFTVWFGCVGKRRGDPIPLFIETLKIGSKEYYLNSPSPYGLLDKEGRWTLVGTERSQGHLCYFLVPKFESQTEFTLFGINSDDFKRWQVSGKLASPMQKPNT